MINRISRKNVIAVTGILLIVSLFSCGGEKKQEVKNIRSITVNGAGATFPYPLYSRWADRYQKITSLKINYQSIGSGGGIAQIKAGTVDFGASDAPLGKDVLDAENLIQFPMIVGGITPVVHLKGIGPGDLKLTPDILAGIYLGKIKRWNDAEIVRINPGLSIPDVDISPIHRADASGTTWIFTNYLSKISPEWRSNVGNAVAVPWPTGVGGKGNEGVSAYIQRINGAIGYVAFAYAVQNNFAYVKLQNQAGEFIAPAPASFRAAMANANWALAPEFYVVLTDQPGADSWPICGPSFILLHKNQENAANTRFLLDFFAWCYDHGSDTAEQLNYVALPQNVIQMVEAEWASQIRVDNKPVWFEKKQTN